MPELTLEPVGVGGEFDDLIVRSSLADTKATRGAFATAGSSFQRGQNQLAATGFGLAAVIADTFGADEFAKSFLRGYTRNMAEAAENPAEVGTFRNIEDAGTLGTYITEAVFENLPNMAASMAGGGVGALAAKGAVARAVGERMVGADVAKRFLASKAGQAAAANASVTGATIGSFAANVGQETGSIAGDIYERTGELKPVQSFLGGMAAGAVETIGDTKLIKQVFGEAAAGQVTKNLARRLGEAGAVQFLKEGGTEAIQTVIEETAAWHAENQPDKPFWTPQMVDSIVDAALKGGFAGAAFGVGGQVWEEARRKEQVKDLRDAADKNRQLGNIRTAAVLDQQADEIELEPMTLEELKGEQSTTTTTPRVRGEAAMETRSPAALGLKREPEVSPDLADAIAAVRGKYNPEIDAPAPEPAPTVEQEPPTSPTASAPTTDASAPAAGAPAPVADVPRAGETLSPTPRPPTPNPAPISSSLTQRPEATMETRPAAPLGLQREPSVSPELADTIEALRQGYEQQLDVPAAVGLDQPSDDVWKINTRRYRFEGYTKARLGDVTEVDVETVEPSEEHDFASPDLIKAYQDGANVEPVILERYPDGTINIVDGSTRLNSAQAAGVKTVKARFVNYADSARVAQAKPAAPAAPVGGALEVRGSVRGISADEIKRLVMSAIVQGGAIDGLKTDGSVDGHYVVIPKDKSDPESAPMAMGPFVNRAAAANFLEAEVGAPGAKVVQVKQGKPVPPQPDSPVPPDQSGGSTKLTPPAKVPPSPDQTSALANVEGVGTFRHPQANEVLAKWDGPLRPTLSLKELQYLADIHGWKRSGTKSELSAALETKAKLLRRLEGESLESLQALSGEELKGLAKQADTFVKTKRATAAGLINWREKVKLERRNITKWLNAAFEVRQLIDQRQPVPNQLAVLSKGRRSLEREGYELDGEVWQYTGRPQTAMVDGVEYPFSQIQAEIDWRVKDIDVEEFILASVKERLQNPDNPYAESDRQTVASNTQRIARLKAELEPIQQALAKAKAARAERAAQPTPLDQSGGPSAQPAQARTVGNSAIDAAIAALDAAKIKTQGIYTLPDLGLTVTLWNGSLDAAKLALRAGRSLAQAVEAGIDWLRAQGQRFDEARVRTALEQTVKADARIAATKARTVAGRTVGTSNPTTKRRSGEGTDPDHNVSLQRLRARNPEAYRKNALLLTRYPLVAREYPDLAERMRAIDSPYEAAEERYENAKEKLEEAKSKVEKALAGLLERKANSIKAAEVEAWMRSDPNSKLTVAVRNAQELVATRKAQRDEAADRRSERIDALAKSNRIFPLEDADRIYETYIKVVESNLEALIKLASTTWRDTARLWYDGANLIAQDFARQFGATLEQASAVLAVFSPQKDWFMNVALARRMMNIWQNDQNTRWSPEMSRQFIKRSGEPQPVEDKETGQFVTSPKLVSEWNPDGVKYDKGARPGPPDADGNTTWLNWDNDKAAKNLAEARELLKDLEGRTLAELKDPDLQARFIRMLSEVRDNPNYPKVTPDGQFGELMRNDNGKVLKIAWGGYNTIEKAIAVMGSRLELKSGDVLTSEADVISAALGAQHKVRSFYNNIVDPANTSGHVTMDTHAIAALLWMPLSGASPEVTQNFGGAGTMNAGELGIKGMYAANAEAYRRAAVAFSLLPREVQSITWEAVRMLFPAKWKADKTNVAKVRDLWEQYRRNELTIDQARNAVFQLVFGRDLAGAIADDSGVGSPSWTGAMGDSSLDSQAAQETNDARVVSEARGAWGPGSGRGAGSAGSVGGGGNPAAVVRPAAEGVVDSAIAAIERIERGLEGNTYSDPLMLVPIAKLALKLAKALLRAGRTLEVAIREGIAQAKAQMPEDTTDAGQLQAALTDAILADAPEAQPQAAPYTGETKESKAMRDMEPIQYRATTNEERAALANDFIDRVHGGDLRAALRAALFPDPLSGIDDQLKVFIGGTIANRAAALWRAGDASMFAVGREATKLLEQLTLSGGGQTLQAGRWAKDNARSSAMVLEMVGNTNEKIDDSLKRIFGDTVVADIREWFKKAGQSAIDALASILGGKNPTLAAMLEIAHRAQRQGTHFIFKAEDRPAMEKLAARIQKSFPVLANYRQFYEQAGVDGLANSFFRLLSGAKAKPEGLIWTADKALTAELAAILRERMNSLGLVKESESASLTDVEKVARVLGKWELRGGKLENLDAKVREEIESRFEADMEAVGKIEDTEAQEQAASAAEARRAMLLDAWSETVGPMANMPVSETMLRRLVMAEVKEQAVDWDDVFEKRTLAETGDAVVNGIANKVMAASSGVDTTELSASIRAVFDSVAAVRQSRWEMNTIAKRAAATLKQTAQPQNEAEAILQQFAKRQSDTPDLRSADRSRIRSLLNAYLKSQTSPDMFIESMRGLGVSRTTAELILQVADRDIAVKQLADFMKQRERLLENKNNALFSLFSKTSAGTDWASLFTSSAANQRQWQRDLFANIRAHPNLQNLSEREAADLTNLLTEAWLKERRRVFVSGFRKEVPLPSVKESDRRTLEVALPDLVKQLNLGLLDNEAFRNAVAPRYGQKPVTMADARELFDKAQAAQAKPEGFQRTRAFRDVYDEMRKRSGIKAWEYLQSWWYASVLSGFGTQGRNILGNASILAENLIASVARNPRAAGALVGGMLRGMRENITQGEFKAIMSGDVTARPGMDIKDAANVLELAKDSPDKWKRLLSNGRYVTRFMLAADSFFYDATAEVAAINEIVAQNKTASWPEVEKAIFEKLNQSPEKRAAAEAKAKAEGLTGTDLDRRVVEILEQQRPSEILDAQHRFALEATLNNEPQGLLGMIAKVLITARDKVPPLVAIVPFVRISANVGNLLLQHSPFGLYYVLRNWRTTGNAEWTRQAIGIREDLTPEEYQQLRAKVLLSHAALMGVLAWAMSGADDDEPWFQVTGSMNGIDPDKRRQLEQQGIRPYSLKFGNRSFDYRQTPWATGFAYVGQVMDAKRYDPKWNEQIMAVKFATALAGGKAVILDQNFLSNLMVLLERGPQMAKDQNANKYLAFLGRTAGGSVPTVAKEVDSWFAPEITKPMEAWDYIQREFPIARRYSGTPVVNVLGDPVERPRYPWSWLTSSASDDPVWQALGEKAQKGVFLPVPSAAATVMQNGKRVKMTPEQFAKYQAEVGKLYKAKLTRDLSRFERMTPEQAAEYFKREFEPLREQARLKVR